MLSWRTKWGFFVWYWVGFKLVATILMVVFGATCLGPWIDRTAADVAKVAEMDQPENMDELVEIGRIAASKQVKGEHFPVNFDVK